MHSWLQRRQSLKKGTPKNKIYATLADKNYAPAPERGGQADDSKLFTRYLPKLIRKGAKNHWLPSSNLVNSNACSVSA